MFLYKKKLIYGTKPILIEAYDMFFDISALKQLDTIKISPVESKTNAGLINVYILTVVVFILLMAQPVRVLIPALLEIRISS